MKYAAITLLTFFSLNSIFAQVFNTDLEPQEVIFENTQQVTLLVKEDTYIPNIQGYACPVPAINLERYHVWDRRLNHNIGGFMVKNFALSVVNPNMQFCGQPSATNVFGTDFIKGAKFIMDITTKREIFHNTRNDGKIEKVLVETITSNLNGINLISSAFLSLGLY